MIFCSFHYFRSVKGNLLTNGIAILLFTLMLFKVSSFHVYTHHDNVSSDIENCTTCELAIENEHTEYLLTAPLVFSNPFLEDNRTKTTSEYYVVSASEQIYYGLFGRPPPFKV